MLSFPNTCGPFPPQNDLPPSNREAYLLPLLFLGISPHLCCVIWNCALKYYVVFFFFLFESSFLFSPGCPLKLTEQEPFGNFVPILPASCEFKKHSWAAAGADCLGAAGLVVFQSLAANVSFLSFMLSMARRWAEDSVQKFKLLWAQRSASSFGHRS